ncbi:MAG: hypothetical protein L0H84_13085 [Pseudonocardia sp.]|nr:hypothetical protein [Pseudonocardia sp.]
MRVIDFGRVPALRSQTLWHALCAATRPGDRPTLSFVRPALPYVSLGYHRALAEVDTEYCGARGLPIFRRMVGGGPVYLDAEQLFFQVTLPARAVAARRAAALAQLMAPAVAALRAVGIDARLDGFGEISVGEAKVCGHGAGQLGEGVVVVGNLITGFDHARATRILRLADDVRSDTERLMRRYVVATPVPPAEWMAALVRAYAAHFGSAPGPGAMTATEQRQRDRMDGLLAQADFVAGHERPARPVRTVKIRAGVWVHEWSAGDRRAVLAIAGGTIDTARGAGVEHLAGWPVDRARDELARDPDTAALAAAIGAANTEVSAA